MFSDKDNINLLTALLLDYGVEHAVVCPGSRNAPLVHNFHEAGMTCYSVTDERSAGFIALGLAKETCSAVVVCVTSGTAVSNLLPAVTEAYYQQVPLIIVSADRPMAWINQMDGQTINQPDALRSAVKRVANLPEPHDETSRWHCRRLINDALIAITRGAKGPVHINVPITEPLYNFTRKTLPKQKVINHDSSLGSIDVTYGLEKLAKARRPLIIIGQTKDMGSYPTPFDSLTRKGYVVLRECLAAGTTSYNHIDEMLDIMQAEGTNCKPDFVMYAGGTLISKRLKQWLRTLKGVPFWRVSEATELEDVSMTLTGWAECDPVEYFKEAEKSASTAAWQSIWKAAHEKAVAKTLAFASPCMSFYAVRRALWHIKNYNLDYRVSSANSLALRYVNILYDVFVHCNRGTNGIEGSLSTAVGMALAWPQPIVHITGDLSFFYDQNALWQHNLSGNLRILLLNNGGGGIFSKFEGLRESSAREDYVMAEHNITAEGICRQFGVAYRCIDNFKDIDEATRWLMTTESDRPMLLEVMSDKEEDMAVLKEYQEFIVKK